MIEFEIWKQPKNVILAKNIKKQNKIRETVSTGDLIIVEGMMANDKEFT